MPGTWEQYRAGAEPLPPTITRWHLTGAGLEALHEVTLDLPACGPEELLVRHDACGICFSDIKIINQGPAHPKLYGRDMQNDPVVMGHEVALTVVGVGACLQDQFRVGQRFLVQADIYVNGVCTPYGYVLPGGMAQYGIVTGPALHGDDGCYLLPLQEMTGYVEAALVEPWACVVAAYEYPNYRTGPRAGGRMLIVTARGRTAGGRVEPRDLTGHAPGSVVRVDDGGETDFTRLCLTETQGAGFDDVIVFGTPPAADLGRIMTALGHRGILNLVMDEPLRGTVPVDVGRVHYEQHLFVSTRDPARIRDAYAANTRRELRPGGKVWFVGAGGPMGQMHLQRIGMLENPPELVLATDSHDDRLERIRARFGKTMEGRGIKLVLLNRAAMDEIAAYGPFDDIVSLVPSAQAIAETMPHLAGGGVYNIFAGLAKGTLAELDLGTILANDQRIVGTSGSSLADIRHTLALVESGKLSTSASLAAIGGMDAYRDGLAAVKAKRFPGKVVIFPLIKRLPLTSIEEMKTRLPGVYARLEGGQFWTKEAEEELLRAALEQE